MIQSTYMEGPNRNQAFTREFKIFHDKTPDRVELESNWMNGTENQGRLRQETYALNPEQEILGRRFKDGVPSQALRAIYNTADHKISAVNQYTLLKVGDEERRFTLVSDLFVQPASGKVKDHPWGPHRAMMFGGLDDIVNLSGYVTRATPESPIRKIQGLYRGRKDKQDVKFEFELPKESNGQIMDFHFHDNAKADEQTMVLVTSTGEKRTYVVKRKDDKVTFELQGKPEQLADLSMYKGTTKTLPGRTSIEATGDGAKGIRVDR